MIAYKVSRRQRPNLELEPPSPAQILSEHIFLCIFPYFEIMTSVGHRFDYINNLHHSTSAIVNFDNRTISRIYSYKFRRFSFTNFADFLLLISQIFFCLFCRFSFTNFADFLLLISQIFLQFRRFIL